MPKYIYVDRHSGFETTYHTFESDKTLTQDAADTIMRKKRGVGQAGLCFNGFISIMSSNGFDIKALPCPKNKEEIIGAIEGIMGTY